ncbi:hypothetical protein ZEAMMB73_Zm00001d047770 [Zea mays]|uniref:Uncharacterized protein n=1 Tax=Zea mays TaxID=4577 RepID=A0A1D6PDB6_MAIZE|nr:hypothetical protein ZEAMMB73_Zm00001d047770 [Zea mays]
MSWLRSAVHRAVEASGGHSSLLTRTVRTSLDTVVHHAGQAVAGGARLITGSRSYKSAKVAAKRLEEEALSCKGDERVQLLRRWLVALKETQRATTAVREPQFGDNPDQTAPLLAPNYLCSRELQDLYIDYDSGAEPMNFFHVFLYSQALECVVLSLIREAPTEEEVPLVSEVFGQAKRDELLQFAQGAISGLKINADIASLFFLDSRLDNEITQLQQQINSMDALHATSIVNQNKKAQTATEVDKLKVLSESLANSSAKAEKRIMENRLQKEESLIFRVTKTNEVSGIEKVYLFIEGNVYMRGLFLRVILKLRLQVNTKLKVATVKLKKTREERDQFDEASNQIVLHLKTKEDELSRSIASCKVEASTVSAWINFLKDTWKLQSLFEELREKQANEELDRCGLCFAKLMKYHVSASMEELSTSIDRIKTFVDNLKIFGNRSVSAEDGANGPSKQSNPRRYLEEEYLQTEKKVVAAFSLVDSIRAIYSSNQDYYKTRRDDTEVKNLFTSIDNLRIEFESVPRPVLQIEIKEQAEKKKRSPSLKVSASPSHSRSDSPIAAQLRTRLPSESESELAKFDQEYKADEISGWEFDDLEDEPTPGFL